MRPGIARTQVLRRPLATERGRASAVTLSLVLVALSGAGLLAAGPRVLGGDVFAGLALLWSVSTIFGLGVAAPTEQLINRRLNASTGSSIRTIAPGLMRATAGCSVAGVLGLGWSDAQSRYPWLVPGLVVAFLGWALCALARGRLLGQADLRAYAQSQTVEALMRLLLVGLSVLGGRASWVPALLASAVALPLFAGAACAAFFETARRPSVNVHARGEQTAFVLYAVSYQVSLNTLPLVLEWRMGGQAPSLTGAFVVANSYFRAATIVVGGVLVHGLSSLSRSWGQSDWVGFSVSAKHLLTRASNLAALSSGVALVAAPWALPILYGGDLGLPARSSVALAASTVAVVAAAALGTALLASERVWHAVCGWASGAVLAVLVAMTVAAPDGVVFWAVLVMPVLPLGVMSAAVRARWRP